MNLDIHPMNPLRLRILFASVVLVSVLTISADVRAIPLFARRYGTTCFTCHTTPPLLNDFGRRFQASGFQLPGSSADPSLQTDQGPFPLALITQPKFAWEQTRNRYADSSAVTRTFFSGVELALFSTASLGPHFSYFAETPIAISARDVSVDVRSAEILYTDVLNDGRANLNFRLGKMMPMVAYPANLILSNVDPLVDTYSSFAIVDSPINTFALVDPMFGISAFGLLPQVFEGLRWEVGLYSGNFSDLDLGVGRALFASLDQTVYLDNAPIRVGLSYLGGSQTVLKVRTAGPRWDNTTDRIAADLDLTDPWTKRIELSMQYMRGFDSHVDSAAIGVHTDMFLLGAQAIVLPERLYVFARLDYAEAKPIGDIHRQVDVGVRYHVLPNVIVTAGGSQLIQTQPRVNDRITTSASAGVLFGF